MAIAGFALFVLGLILMIVAPINKRKNARCSEQTRGMLTEIVEREDSDGPLPDMYVYTYYVDGIAYQIKTTIRSKEANQAGEPCTIWYNPKKPKDAQPFHYDSAKVYRIILIIGIVTFLLGLVLMAAGIGR